MKFISKLIPFFAGLTVLSVFGMGPTIDASDTLTWIFRSFVGLAIAVIAYLVKGIIDDNKFNDRNRDGKIDNLITVTAAHEVMYRYWLENLKDDRVQSEKLQDVIKQIAKTRE